MTWARFFDGYEPVHALVAERGGELLGLTHYLFHRSTTVIEPICYLQDLFTSAAARGKGVGRALINGVYEQAQLAGGSRVYWQTHETNHTAMQLYDKVAERSGFVVYRKFLTRSFQPPVDKSGCHRRVTNAARFRLRMIRPPVSDHTPQAAPVSRRV